MNFFNFLFQNEEMLKAAANSKYDAELHRLREVNEAKRIKAIERLGEKWLLHPNNTVKCNSLKST